MLYFLSLRLASSAYVSQDTQGLHVILPLVSVIHIIAKMVEDALWRKENLIVYAKMVGLENIVIFPGQKVSAFLQKTLFITAFE